MKTETRYIMNGFLDVTFQVMRKLEIEGFNPRFDIIRAVEVAIQD